MVAMTDLWVVAGALLLDAAFGEPRRWHPLVGFGQAAAALEARMNRAGKGGHARGLVALAALVLPPVALAVLFVLMAAPWLEALVATIVLSVAVGWRSLREHAQAVAVPLAVGELGDARSAVARMVSRDSNRLDEAGVANAATESVLENGADAVFASLFWYLLAGIPGVLLHRLVNTLDAMWGYRNNRFVRFGWAAARLDDVLNWVPARLTAMSYALCGRLSLAIRCWRTQARHWESPNAGPVMAAGAGALGVQLGGPAPYASGWRQRPVLGQGCAPTAADLQAAMGLVDRAVALWLAALLAASGIIWTMCHGGGLGAN